MTFPKNNNEKNISTNFFKSRPRGENDRTQNLIKKQQHFNHLSMVDIINDHKNIGYE